MQTVWTTLRALAMATGLLVHEAAPRPSAAALALPASAEMAAEHWHHVPHGMSMEQALAALSR